MNAIRQNRLTELCQNNFSEIVYIFMTNYTLEYLRITNEILMICRCWGFSVPLQKTCFASQNKNHQDLTQIKLL